jgi:hypothetical protein
MSDFPTFREIVTGGLTREQLLDRLAENKVRFNGYAERLFRHPAFSPGETRERAELVTLTLPDLGLPNPCSFPAIAGKGSALGLRLCPLPLGAFLRLAYLDQPEGPYLTVASPAPESDEDYPKGFYLRRYDGAVWLRGYRASGACEWPAGGAFVFLK